jgi:hypothetical protein
MVENLRLHSASSNLTGTAEQIDTAIVFGAGASLPALPSQQGLVDRLHGARPHPRIALAQRYLRRVFPGLPNPTIRFEDVVGPLEIAEAEEYWFHFAGTSSDHRRRLVTNKAVLDSLDTWLAMSLDPETIPKPPSARRTTATDAATISFRTYYAPSADGALPYSRLIYLLSLLDSLKNTGFLSMNYDVLLDRVLYASETNAPDYVVDGFYRDTSESPPDQTVINRITLLKLHGSLNWRSCDTCHTLRNLGSFVVWPESHCIDCGSEFARPMLIRPTLLKDFRHRVWQGLWRNAGHVLAGAKTWIFIGYSLPLADVWMLRLLAQSCRSGSIPVHDRRIVVVNLDPNVKDRFALLFPRLDFRYESFEAWVNGCLREGRLR